MKKSNPFKIHSTLIASVGAALALAAPLKATPLFTDPFTTADGPNLAAVNANIATRQTGTLANNAYALTTAFSNISISGNQLVTGSDTGHYNYANFLPSLTTSPTNFTLSFDAKNTGTGGWFSPFLTTHASVDLRGVSEFGLIIFQGGAVVAYGGTGMAQTGTTANTALVPDWNVSNMNHYDLVAAAATANTGTYSVFINGVNVVSGIPYHLGTGVTPTAGHTGLFFAHRNVTSGGGIFDNVSLSTVVPSAYWDRNTTTVGACDALTPDTAPGTWGASDTHWNAVDDGTGPTAAWTPGVTAVFAAGTDANGAYDVTVDGTQMIGGLSFEEGMVSLLAGTLPSLTLNANSEVAVAAGLTATIATPLVDDGNARILTKDGAGTLVLSGANSTTAASTMSIKGGTVRFDSTSAIYGTGKNITVNANAVAMFGTLNNTDIATGLDRIVATSAGTIAADNNDSGNFDLNTAGLTAAYFGAVGTVNYTGLLTPNGNYRLGGAGGTLTMANANALTGSGVTLTVRGPGTVVLPLANDYTGATTVSGGILQVDGSLAAGGGLVTVATGGTLNVGPSGSVARDVTISGGTVGLAGTISEAGTKLTLASGTVATSAGSPTVATADFSAGTGTATANIPLAITSTLKLPGGISATLIGGTSFTATGANLADNNAARTLSLSGGTLGVAVSGGAPINLSSTGLNIADAAHIKAQNYYTPDGRAPKCVSDWSGMTGPVGNSGTANNTYGGTTWLDFPNAAGTSYISWDLGSTYTISSIHIWNYNEVNLPIRGTKQLHLQTGDATAFASNTGWVNQLSNVDWESIGANGTITGTVKGTGANGYGGFHWTLPAPITTRYLRFETLAHFAGGDSVGLSEVLFFTPVLAVSLPNTAVAATATSTLDMGSASANHTLGTLSITNSGTQLTLPLAAGATIAFATGSPPWDGTLNITGTFVSGSSLRFGTDANGLTSTQLAAISATGFSAFALDANGYLTATGSGGGYAAWQSANGATGQAADLDHDGDGVANGIEYFLGGSSDTTGFTPLPGITNTGGVLSITWIKGSGYNGDYGTDFWVETSATLADPWTTESEGVTVTVTATDVTYTFPAPLGTKNFARLKVIQ